MTRLACLRRLRHPLLVDPFTVAAAIGVGLAALGTSWFVRRFADLGTAQRALRRTALSTVAEVKKEGKPVKIAGVAASVADPMIAPFSGQPCVAYRVRVVASSERDYRQLLDEHRAVTFLVTDTTGHARLEGAEVKLAVETETVVAVDGAAVPPPAVVALLQAHGLPPLGAEALTVEEAVIAIGAPVEAFGCAELALDPGGVAPNYRSAARELRLRPSRRFPVVVAHPAKAGNDGSPTER